MDREFENDKKLNQAFLDDYRKIEDLEMMVKFELGENLYDIVSKQSDRKYIVFELIGWSISNGIIKKLIKGAYEYKQGNENLKQYYELLFPFSRPSNNLISGGNRTSLENILLHIDFEILQEISKLTLKSQTEDIAGQIPEIFEFKSIPKIIKFFLEKYPLRQRDKIPTILEFAQRLCHCDRVNINARNSLNLWLYEAANSKDILLPIEYQRLPQRSDQIIDPCLFIILNEEPGNKFSLTSELATRYETDYFSTIPIELDQQYSQFSSLEEIANIISKFLELAWQKLTIEDGYIVNNFIVELFLPHAHLKESIDLQQVICSGDRLRPIGEEYFFTIRCLDRYSCDLSSGHGQYLNALRKKWLKLQELFETRLSSTEVQGNLTYISCINKNHNWEKTLMKLRCKEVISVNLTCCLPDDGRENDFFRYLLISGIPLSLWNRSPNFDCLEVQQQFSLMLNLDLLNNPIELHNNICQIRRDAHVEQQEASSYLGYHLGFLLDNPNIIPLALSEHKGGDNLTGFEN